MRFEIITTLLLLISPILSAAPPPKDQDCGKTVKPGQSIQSAIDSARPGAEITVEPGTYHEQLTITKDGIHLIGKDAILLPPTDGYKPNFCTGLTKSFEPENKDTNAGICIYGRGFELAPYDRALQHRKISKTGTCVRDVVISGFEIHKFTGENIALIGAHNARIRQNKLVDGAQYGFLTIGSQGTEAEKNVVTSSGLAFIAMCMDDEKDARFERNDISNYYVALCTQTSGGVVKQNTVKGCCYGPFVDPGIVGVQIIGNTISTRNPGCLTTDGSGIAVLGAVNTRVQGNTVEGFQFNNTGLGIFVSDDPVTGAKATGNLFVRNVLSSNNLDIYNVAGATDNVFSGNKCEKSLPVGLCAA